jgi:hypothetical protein
VTYLLTLPHKLNNSLKEWVISFSCKIGRIKDMKRKEVVNANGREEKNKEMQETKTRNERPPYIKV